MKEGIYINPFTNPTLEECATILYPPSYLSLEKALNNHNVLPQACYTMTFVTTRNDYNTSIREVAIEYNHIPQELFFGYSFDRFTNSYIASPEKAYVDWLYVRGIKDKIGEYQLLSMPDEMELIELDVNKIEQIIKDIKNIEIASDVNMLYSKVRKELWHKFSQ
ncbi:hypothetical protein ACAG39_05280 [Caldicellulosiruptoraceae bacterium PP1]